MIPPEFLPDLTPEDGLEALMLAVKGVAASGVGLAAVKLTHSTGKNAKKLMRFPGRVMLTRKTAQAARKTWEGDPEKWRAIAPGEFRPNLIGLEVRPTREHSASVQLLTQGDYQADLVRTYFESQFMGDKGDLLTPFCKQAGGVFSADQFMTDCFQRETDMFPRVVRTIRGSQDNDLGEADREVARSEQAPSSLLGDMLTVFHEPLLGRHVTREFGILARTKRASDEEGLRDRFRKLFRQFASHSTGEKFDNDFEEDTRVQILPLPAAERDPEKLVKRIARRWDKLQDTPTYRLHVVGIGPTAIMKAVMRGLRCSYPDLVEYMRDAEFLPWTDQRSALGFVLVPAVTD